jgi:hypothetical protein
MDVGIAVLVGLLVGLLFVGGCVIGGFVVHAVLTRRE